MQTSTSNPEATPDPALADVPTADLLAELRQIGQREAAILNELARRQNGGDR